jgi:cyclopropane fatty-acyl-phospholipid synthase-like methyltransferase
MTKKTNRLYKDLAWLWPLWEELEIYKKESNRVVNLIRKHSKIKARTLLDMGCGGGKNAFHFKKHFEVTGIDISKQMLKNARNLNPECKFITGDMRNFDLKKQFDSVFINDAHSYMTTQRDLLKTFKMADKHLKPGGVMIVHPGKTKSKFKQNTTYVWRSKRGDMDITFIQHNFDPNPRDNTFERTFIFLIRKKGKLRIEHDFHPGGIFTLNVWRKLLKQAGFKIREEKDKMTSGVPAFTCFKFT